MKVHFDKCILFDFSALKMENGRENATQLSTMIFYIARNPFSNQNISCLLYFKRKPIFSALLTHLRRLKQANIGNRFHSVLVKITRPAFTKA